MQTVGKFSSIYINSGNTVRSGDGLVTPLLNSIAVKQAPANRKGAAIATFSLFNGIGSSIGGGLWGKVS